jgi:ferredoxin
VKTSGAVIFARAEDSSEWFSLRSSKRVTHHSSTCIECAKCATACLSALPIDRLAPNPVGRLQRVSEVCGHLPSKGHAGDQRIGGSAQRRDICNVLLGHPIKQDDHFRQNGDEALIDDKTLFRVK